MEQPFSRFHVKPVSCCRVSEAAGWNWFVTFIPDEHRTLSAKEEHEVTVKRAAADVHTFSVKLQGRFSIFECHICF